jgi:FkbM family methyltransferase
LDVGANEGQTLDAVLEFSRFDRIYCFEPCSEPLAKLYKKAGMDRRIRVLSFGLWDRSDKVSIYSPGTESASVHPDKMNVDPAKVEDCHMVEASVWFRNNLHSEDEIYMKLNCEGAECDILDNLLDSGEAAKLTAIAVDFDVRKVPSQCHREGEVRSRIDRKDWLTVWRGGQPFSRTIKWLESVVKS